MVFWSQTYNLISSLESHYSNTNQPILTLKMVWMIGVEFDVMFVF